MNIHTYVNLELFTFHPPTLPHLLKLFSVYLEKTAKQIFF